MAPSLLAQLACLQEEGELYACLVRLTPTLVRLTPTLTRTRFSGSCLLREGNRFLRRVLSEAGGACAVVSCRAVVRCGRRRPSIQATQAGCVRVHGESEPQSRAVLGGVSFWWQLRVRARLPAIFCLAAWRDQLAVGPLDNHGGLRVRAEPVYFAIVVRCPCWRPAQKDRMVSAVSALHTE
jgi:hypothetical protein